MIIIKYLKNEIFCRSDDLKKSSTEIIDTGLILSINKLFLDNLSSFSNDFYKKNCNSYTDDICCFTHYSRMETNKFLNETFSRVGGIFSFCLLLHLSGKILSLGERKITEYLSSKKIILKT